MPDNDFPYSQPTPHRIDVDAVIRRARRRRVPGKIGVALVSTLAVAGLVGGGVFGLAHLPETSSGSAASGASNEINPQTEPAPAKGQADKAAEIRCGAAAPELTPRPDGLVVSATAKQTAGSPDTLTARVTISNSGPRAHLVAAGWASVLLVRDGVVVWHSSGTGAEAAPVSLDLKRGTSRTFTVHFLPQICHAGDDPNGELRTELAAAPAGKYALYGELNATIDGTAQDVSGPASAVILH